MLKKILRMKKVNCVNPIKKNISKDKLKIGSFLVMKNVYFFFFSFIGFAYMYEINDNG